MTQEQKKRASRKKKKMIAWLYYDRKIATSKYKTINP